MVVGILVAFFFFPYLFFFLHFHVCDFSLSCHFYCFLGWASLSCHRSLWITLLVYFDDWQITQTHMKRNDIKNYSLNFKRRTKLNGIFIPVASMHLILQRYFFSFQYRDKELMECVYFLFIILTKLQKWECIALLKLFP